MTAPDLIAEDFSKFYGTSDQLTATLKDGDDALVGYLITFTINGVDYDKTTDANGVASLNVNLLPGSYSTTVSFDGDSDYDAVSETITVTVIGKYTTSISASDYTKVYGESGQLVCRLVHNSNGVSGKPVDFTVNSVKYTKTTDSDGYARLNINLPVGNYSTSLAFNGDDHYKPSSKTVNVKVMSGTVLGTSDFKKRHSEAKQFQCSVKNTYGEPLTGNISFLVNGVTYNKPIENGVASLTIRLPEGKYKITSTFSGDADNTSAKVENNIIVIPDADPITTVENGLTVPPDERGFMESKIFVRQYTPEFMKEGYYLNPAPDWTLEKNLQNPIQFTSYEITETDPRVKTAKFTTPQYFDLTNGVIAVLISSPYHENFAGIILKIDYDKSTKLYTYQCQDGRREYISKSLLRTSGTAVNAYEILEALLVFPQFPKGSSSIPISEELRQKHQIALSGLRPIDDYNIKLSPVSTPINNLKNTYPKILSYDTIMDKIMNVAHVGQTPIDVHFTTDLRCQIEPVDLDRWVKEGLKLVHSDLVHYKYKFDTTNIITRVSVKDNKGDISTDYQDWNELRWYFGQIRTIIDPVTTTSNTSNTQTTTTSSSGSGSSIMSGKKTFVIGCDGGTSTARIREAINALTARGHTCINVGQGPSSMVRYGLKAASKGKIGVFICNGIDGGALYDFVQPYYHFDHVIIVFESQKATTDKWLTCNGMKNTKLYIDPRQGYSAVVYRSGVENYTAYQWCQKYPKLHYVCGPLGCSWSDVLNNFVNGKFGSDGASTTTTTSTNASSSTTQTVNELQTYEKALEEVTKSIRDLLSFEIRVPLNNTLFKNLHTNQMLHTELPPDFKLINLEKIFKIMGSYKVSRGVPYVEHRWYVEKVNIKHDSNGLFADITLNPFPSSYSVYANALTKYAEAYDQAFNSSSNTVSTNGTTLTGTGTGLGNPLLGNDCTSTNSMCAMGGGKFGNSGHGKNFDKAAQKGYAKQGANYYNWARQYSNVKDLLHALASKFRYSRYSGNRTCPQGVFNTGTIRANCYDACRLVKVCCDACGFPCVIVVGTIYEGGHGWNAVKYNGTWYTFDLCYTSKTYSSSGTNSFRSVW